MSRVIKVFYHTFPKMGSCRHVLCRILHSKASVHWCCQWLLSFLLSKSSQLWQHLNCKVALPAAAVLVAVALLRPAQVNLRRASKLDFCTLCVGLHLFAYTELLYPHTVQKFIQNKQVVFSII